MNEEKRIGMWEGPFDLNIWWNLNRLRDSLRKAESLNPAP
jgi:hypothetical protein